MPIKLTQEKLAGHTILRMTSWGQMVSADIDAMRAEIDPGKNSHGLPQLIIAEGGEGGMDKSFRERLTEVSPKRVGVKFPVAIVMNRPLMSAAMDFILRVLRYDTARVFKTEAEGVAWLTKELPAFLEKRKPYA